MRREQADKFIGKLVRLTFKYDWFNEATQSWVNEDDELIGIFNRCSCPTQTQYYVLDSDKCLPTHNACWSANRIKTIKEVLL